MQFTVLWGELLSFFSCVRYRPREISRSNIPTIVVSGMRLGLQGFQAGTVHSSNGESKGRFPPGLTTTTATLPTHTSTGKCR